MLLVHRCLLAEGWDLVVLLTSFVGLALGLSPKCHSIKYDGEFGAELRDHSDPGSR